MPMLVTMAGGMVIQGRRLAADEIGLIRGLMAEHGDWGRTRLSDWLKENARSVGTSYSSELRRHYR